MDFSNLSLVDTANKKKGNSGGGRKAGQRFTGIRFTRSEGKKGIISKFTCSDVLWKNLNLDACGFFQLDGKNEQGEITAVFLGTSPITEEGALRPRMLRQREGSARGKSFKSTNLEDALTEAGLLTEDFGKTFFKLTEAGEYKGRPMFSISIDETVSAKTEEKSDKAPIAEGQDKSAEAGTQETGEYDANTASLEEEEEGEL